MERWRLERTWQESSDDAAGPDEAHSRPDRIGGARRRTPPTHDLSITYLTPARTPFGASFRQYCTGSVRWRGQTSSSVPAS